MSPRCCRAASCSWAARRCPARSSKRFAASPPAASSTITVRRRRPSARSPSRWPTVWRTWSARRPVPAGVTGELCIGGAGVAHGYIHAPELTAERFVPHPIHGEAGGRVYLTGDRVRRRLDGRIDFLGRIDDQVKIRGFRVEPAEVESVLSRCPGIAQAVVLPQAAENGEIRLTGFILPATESGTSPDEARRYLADRLPDYMVPASLAVVDQMPLTPNGKVDRRALRDMATARQAGGQADSADAPRNEVEEALLRIWSGVLEADRIGINDSFFDLGGHSLAAIKVISRVREELGVHLSMATMFDAPTIAGLAKIIDAERQPAGADASLDAIMSELSGLSDEDIARLLENDTAPR